ncbi:MAG: hypothetical protein H6636_03130 [Anaerolineales bacterium]|nr:hypothetical protein [Anaerolineales bacterium]
MATIQLNRQSAFKLRWPTNDEDIIANAETWIAYESSRSLADQLKDPWLTLIQTQLDAAKTARNLAHAGEAARTEARDAYRIAVDTVRSLLQRALAFLKFKHADHLPLLEHWGWNVRQSKRGGYTVKMPAKDLDVIHLLEFYVAYEATRGTEQISDPPLTTLQNLLVDIQDLAQNLGSSKAQRTTNIFIRGSAAYKLQDLLQGAAFAISLLQYDGEVHPDLANWGYTLVGATPTNGSEPPVEESAG